MQIKPFFMSINTSANPVMADSSTPVAAQHPLLQPLDIGGLSVENRLMVAPMAGVTETLFVDCANLLAQGMLSAR